MHVCQCMHVNACMSQYVCQCMSLAYQCMRFNACMSMPVSVPCVTLQAAEDATSERGHVFAVLCSHLPRCLESPPPLVSYWSHTAANNATNTATATPSHLPVRTTLATQPAADITDAVGLGSTPASRQLASQPVPAPPRAPEKADDGARHLPMLGFHSTEAAAQAHTQAHTQAQADALLSALDVINEALRAAHDVEVGRLLFLKCCASWREGQWWRLSWRHQRCGSTACRANPFCRIGFHRGPTIHPE